MLLVTGGAGFIGSNFLHYLLTVTDEEVVVVDSLTYAANKEYVPSQYTLVNCDIGDKEHVDEVFAKYKPRKVFNFAAESHVDNSIKNVDPFIRTNIIGTCNLLRASVDNDVHKFHHVSTDEVYGSLEYDDTKLFTEDTPYGPRQHPEKLIPKVIHNALNNKVTNMHGGGHQIRDWIYAEDHCRAIWTLDEQNILNDKYNISAAHELPNIEVTKKILDILDKPYSLIGKSNERPGLDQRYATDYSKLRKKTGWVPKAKFDNALKDTVDWYLKRLPS